MMPEFIASFSAALAVWGWGATAFGLWRLREVWDHENERRTILLAGATLVAMGIGVHQSLAWWAWETGAWNGAVTTHGVAVLYRVLWAFGLLFLAGAASWPRCRNRGWLMLLAIGGVAWMVAWAI